MYGAAARGRELRPAYRPVTWNRRAAGGCAGARRIAVRAPRRRALPPRPRTGRSRRASASDPGASAHRTRPLRPRPPPAATATGTRPRRRWARWPVRRAAKPGCRSRPDRPRAAHFELNHSRMLDCAGVTVEHQEARPAPRRGLSNQILRQIEVEVRDEHRETLPCSRVGGARAYSQRVTERRRNHVATSTAAAAPRS